MKTYVITRARSDETGFESFGLIRTVSPRSNIEETRKRLDNLARCAENMYNQSDEYHDVTRTELGKNAVMIQYSKDAILEGTFIKEHARIIYKIEELA